MPKLTPGRRPDAKSCDGPPIRRAEFICKLPRETLTEVIDKLGALLLSDS